jgi:hypothetical protein
MKQRVEGAAHTPAGGPVKVAGEVVKTYTAATARQKAIVQAKKEEEKKERERQAEVAAKEREKEKEKGGPAVPARYDRV